MTGKQIEAARKALSGSFSNMTPKQRQQYDELSCREMINSCLVYGEGYDFYDSNSGKFGPAAERHVKQLGEKTALRLFKEQVDDFSKAIVHYGVFTDDEGCTYNSCTWADER